MNSRKTSVVYIGGAGRSGSTLLDNLLGSSPGWFSAGELRLLWSARQLWTHRCGCGLPLRNCDLWSAVLATTGDVDLAWAADMDRRMLRSRQAWRVFRRGGISANPEEDRFVELTGRVPRAVSTVTGEPVVVDSSKSPTRVAVLAASGLDVAVVHLVRDPRAIAWSWRRSAHARDETHPFTPRTTAAAAAEWTANNVAIETVVRRTGVRCTRVRYEDLVDDPARTLASIADLVGTELDVPIAGSTATLCDNHTVAGNPSRFRTGAVSLRRDDEWRTRLAAGDRRLTTALTLPLLRRYRYPTRTH